MMYNGYKILVDPNLTERVRFSRSPSRSDRREKKGFPQNYITRPKSEVLIFEGNMVMHPNLWAAMQKEINLQVPV